MYARGKTDRGRQWLARARRHPQEVVLIGDTLFGLRLLEAQCIEVQVG